MGVSLSVEIIAATASIVTTQAPVIALDGTVGISWSLIQNVIAKNLSVFIAGVALFIAIFQAHTTRKHNQLSVKPFLTINQMLTYGKDSSELSFELRNVGVGPAIIKRYIVFFDDIQYDLRIPKARDLFKNFLFDSFRNPSFFFLAEERAIAAGEFRELINGNVFVPTTEAETFMRRFGFKIEYQSIYQNETFLLETHNEKGYPKN